MNRRESLICPKCHQPIGHKIKVTFFNALASGFAAELILWVIVGVLGVVVSSVGFGPVFAVALLVAGGVFAFLISRSRSFICQSCSESVNVRIVQKYNKSLNADADKAGAG